jgi:hypothetical protein
VALRIDDRRQPPPAPGRQVSGGIERHEADDAGDGAQN